MDIALATAALVPGAVSLSLATGPRCRAIAPRELPSALIGTLAFTSADLGLAALTCKCIPGWGAPSLGPMAAALISGETCQGISRADAIASLLTPHWQNFVGLVFLAIATWFTGWSVGHIHRRLLRVIALGDGDAASLEDPRSDFGRSFDAALSFLGLQFVAEARGASYWLVVKEMARLVTGSRSELEVFADITQGDDSTLFAGRVIQVIAASTGAVHSVVLRDARRYRRGSYGERDELGNTRVFRKPEWRFIGASEAFFLRGDNIHNISYRIYGDPSRGGFEKKQIGEWKGDVPTAVLKAAKVKSETRGQVETSEGDQASNPEEV